MKIPDDIYTEMQNSVRKVFYDDPVKLRYELKITAHIKALGEGFKNYKKEYTRLLSQF